MADWHYGEWEQRSSSNWADRYHPDARVGVKVASTTDTMDATQEAANGDYEGPAPAPNCIAEEPEHVKADASGTIEHGRITRLIDGKPEKVASDRHLADHFASMSPQQRLANRQNYIRQREEAAATLPNYAEVAFDESVELPGHALEMIADAGLPNAAYLQHYLGEHKEVAASLIGLSRKQVQTRMRDLSTQLMTHARDMALDKLPFDQYRRIRNEQISRRYR